MVETKSLMGRTFVVRGDHKCWVSGGRGGGVSDEVLAHFPWT